MTNNLLSFDPAPATVTMSSLQIADLVESRHDSVKRAIERLVTSGVIAQPPTVDVQETGGNNRTYTTQAYVFNGEQGKRDSIVIVAQLSPAFTARLVDRWQELEAHVARPQLPDFTKPAVAARAWAEQYELAADRQAQLERQQPAVEFAQAIQASDDTISLADMAKLLHKAGFNTGRNRLSVLLKEDGVLLQDGTPAQSHIQYFELTEKPFTSDSGRVHITLSVRVNPRGQAYLLKRYTPKRPASRAVIDALKGLGGFTKALSKAA